MNSKGVLETYYGTLVGYKRIEQIETENFSSHQPKGSEWTTFYLKTDSNIMTFEVKIEAGECASGYATCTYGSLESVRKFGILEKDNEMKELDIYIMNAKILVRKVVDSTETHKNDLFEIYQDDTLIIWLDVDGNDDYYPCGSIIYQQDIEELFYTSFMHTDKDEIINENKNTNEVKNIEENTNEVKNIEENTNEVKNTEENTNEVKNIEENTNEIKNTEENTNYEEKNIFNESEGLNKDDINSIKFRGKRGFDKEVKYIFAGKSNTTKSTLALKIFEKYEIYETDSMKNEYDFLNIDITQYKVIVLGGKYIKSDASISNIVKYYVSKYPQYQFIQCFLSCV